MNKSLTLTDLETISEKLNILINQYASDINRIRFAHCINRDDEARYAARIFKEQHSDILDLHDKIYDIIADLKRKASADKPLNIEIPIKEPTLRYKVQIEYFDRIDDLNKFLDRKDIEYVDLKISERSNYYLMYRSIEFDN